jgi:hypothetical protein
MVESTRGIGAKIETDPVLHHIIGASSNVYWPDHPSSLRDRELSALFHGHDLPRCRMPRPLRKRPRQLHHHHAMAHNLIRRASGKDSLRLRRKVAAWDDDFLVSLLTLRFLAGPLLGFEAAGGAGP